jgi:hypothetical protein
MTSAKSAFLKRANGAADNLPCGSRVRQVEYQSPSAPQRPGGSYRSKVGFIRLFGGGAGLALDRRWLARSTAQGRRR